jgi:hypothetical protein
MAKLSNQISFNSWVIQFKTEKSDYGIFARWFLDRTGGGLAKPKSVTKKTFLRELQSLDSSQFLQDTFVELWNQFKLVPNAVTAPRNQKKEFEMKIRI